jgi:thiamine transport system substrate-binding protein
MKLRIFFFSVFISVGTGVLLGGGNFASAKQTPELVIYTYDTFNSSEGLGPAIFPIFEAKHKCRIRALSSGDGAQILNRLELDSLRKKPAAHLVIGIDQPLWGRSKKFFESWGEWQPADYSRVIREIRVESGFLPIDYGTLTWMVDSQKLRQAGLKVPSSLSDLLKPEWRKNIILEDPRTSTPGLAFLLYTQAVLGESVWNYWKQFRTQWLTLAPGWDQAYGLFLKKEAPLVWSYTTSQAYHESKNETHYQAIHFQEGQPVQIEGAALVKNPQATEQERALAKKFLEFLISPEVQKRVPEKTWMMPVRKDVALPQSYKKLPKPTRLVPLQMQADEISKAFALWQKAIHSQ